MTRRVGGSLRHVTARDEGAPIASVSVIVPCYNYGRFLGAAVESATTQEGVDVDVVIIDDASTDDSTRIADELAARDSRITVVAHARNRGHVETYNEGLGLARGEFVVKLDADDLLTPGSLKRSTDLMTEFPDVSFCYGPAVEFSETAPVVGDSAPTGWTIWDGAAWTERVLRRGHNVILQPEVLLRRSAVLATEGYRTQLRWAEDYNWWLRLAAIGDVGRIRGAAQGLYRVHPSSLQRSVSDIEMADLSARVDAVELYFAEQSRPSGRLQRVAYTSLIRDARRLAARALQRSTGGSAASTQFSEMAKNLEQRAGFRVRPGLSAAPNPIGRAYRDLEWRLRWRRWQKWGV